MAEFNKEEIYGQIDAQLKDGPVLSFQHTELTQAIKDCIYLKYSTWEDETNLYVSTKEGKKAFYYVTVEPQIKKFDAVIKTGFPAAVDLKKTPKYFLDAIKEKYPSSWEENGKLCVGTEKMFLEMKLAKEQKQKDMINMISGGLKNAFGNVAAESIDESESDDSESESDDSESESDDSDIDPKVKADLIDDQFKLIRNQLVKGPYTITAKSMPPYILEAINKESSWTTWQMGDTLYIGTKQMYDETIAQNDKRKNAFDSMLAKLGH